MDFELENKIFDLFSKMNYIAEKLLLPIIFDKELSLNQFILLVSIQKLDVTTVSEVSEMAKINMGNCSGMCKKLEQCGLLHRERSKYDERRVELRLTDKGDLIITDIYGELHKKYESALTQYTKADEKAFQEGLNQVNYFFETLE